MWKTRLALAMTALTIAAITTMATAGTAAAAQRVDLRVLLLSGTGDEPSYTAWQAQLRREGVPFDALVARAGHAPITAATLATRLPDGTDVGRYQAIVLATGGLASCGGASCLSTAEWTALATYEQTFHVRRLTAYTYPGVDYGLTTPTVSGALDGQTANLTASGLQAFPYLKGPVTMAAGSFGYQSRPAAGARFDTLLTGPGGSSLLGVFTHPDGREELVQTFDANQFQLQSWLLRHGELNWVTRGVHLGEQRNYLELQVDDVFLPDDTWDVARHVTNYDPAAAIRMTAADVTRAVDWTNATGVRMDMVYNGGGSDAHAAANGGDDPLLDALLASRASFNWVNHTWDHPNLDCSTRPFIAAQIADNTAWAQQHGFAVDPRELVTGEHSGLANLVPGNPGTIDPPSVDDAEPVAGGGTLGAGTFDYAVTGVTAHGETVGSVVTVVVAANGATDLAWDAICHATSYRVYRRVSPAGAWALLGSVPHPANAFGNGGPVAVAFRDTGAAGTAGAPPGANSALVDPYGQNPSFAGALQDAGVTVVGSDASKPYPQTPTSTTGAVWPAGASFVAGGVRAVPRYPTNVYYNVATQAQLLDEYNYLYLPPALGGVCVNTAVTTCESAPVTWATLMQREADRIFGHVMGNDPRPHYFHQSNIAQTDRAGGGVLYPVLDATLASYARFFAANSPIVQLRHAAIADLLARQAAWAGASASQVTGWIQGNVVTLANAGGATVTVPLTGTEVGDPYGGTRSGWTSAAPGVSTHTAAISWPGTAAPPVVTPPVTQPVVPPPNTPPQSRPVVHAPAPPSAPRPPALVSHPDGGPNAAGGPAARSGRRAAARRARRARRRLRCAARKRRVVRTVHGRRRHVAKARRGCRPRARRQGGKPHRPAAQQRRGN